MAKVKNALNAMTAVDDWQVEDDLRTLMRAEEIEKDPKRYKAAKELAKKKLLEMASIAGGEGENS